MNGLLAIFSCCAVMLCFPLMSIGASAQVTLSRIFSDHMVLQRDKPVHLCGMADPFEKLTARFRGNSATTEADALGRWSLYLPPGDAGGPFVLVVEGTNTLRLNDVLVGDLWLASGQSNMEFPMKQTPPWTTSIRNMQQELEAANYPRIRLLHIAKTVSNYPETDVKAVGWDACTPESVSDFSAVAYFFARELEQKEHVPIGVIEASWGGTPAEAWTSLDALSADSSLMPVFQYRAHMMDGESTTLLDLQKTQAEVDRKLAQGQSASMPWHPDPDAWAPGALFNGMIAPLVSVPIRGVIWYQGESNTDPEQAPIYEHLFSTLIEDWRAKWGIGDFPFLFVQIANYGHGELWPVIREAQRRSLAVANTGMAVTIDIGETEQIHPSDKQDVGHRLALLARAVAYGEHVEDSGPLFRQTVPEGGRMRVWFDHAGGGLIAKGDRLSGFEVAGADGKFVAAKAEIAGETVIVSSAAVAKPLYVRYGWAADPHCNLFNREELPASPFTSQP
jgi:sialate O-acetylesterase